MFDIRPALLYLCVPALIFAVGFLTPVIAVPIVILAAAAFILVWSHGKRDGSPGAAPLLIALVGAGLAVFLTGFPDGPFAWDWIKHWAVLQSLTTHPWPVVETIKGSPEYLRYYTGAYLVPALILKAIPAIAPALAYGAWLFLGYVLVFRAVGAIGKTWIGHVAAIVLIMVIGGADVYADQIWRLINQLPALPWLGVHYDPWMSTTLRGPPFEYSSFVTSIAWVPNQAIPTFLVAAILLLRTDKGGTSATYLGYGALAVWAPFGMIGLLPHMLLMSWQRRRQLLSWPVILGAMAGGAIALPTAIYLSTDLPTGSLCITCLPERVQLLAPIYLFLFVELIPIGLILGKRIIRDPLSATSLAVLVVLPFLHGSHGDIVMRGAIGPLFILGWRCVEQIATEQAPRMARAFQVLAIVLCAPTALSEAVYIQNAGQLPSPSPPQPAWVLKFTARTDDTMTEFLDEVGWGFAPQYLSGEKPRLSR